LIEEDRQARELLEHRKKRRNGRKGHVEGKCLYSRSTTGTVEANRLHVRTECDGSDSDETATAGSGSCVGKEDRVTLTGRRLRRKRSKPSDDEASEPQAAMEDDVGDDTGHVREAEDEEVDEREEGAEEEEEAKEASRDEESLTLSEEKGNETEGEVEREGSGGDYTDANAVEEVGGEESHRQLLDVKMEDDYDGDRGEADYEDEPVRGKRKKRQAKDSYGQGAFQRFRETSTRRFTSYSSSAYLGKRKVAKRGRSFDDRRELWDQLWEEKYHELVK
jgi:hypothetical protein